VPEPTPTRGQNQAPRLIPERPQDDNHYMALVETVHSRLCELVGEMMQEVCGRPIPRAHLSFLALGATEDQAAELTGMVNALFGLDLPADTALRSPTPDAMARTIEIAFSGTPAELVDLIDAIADAA
jgi:hypothetical protein